MKRSPGLQSRERLGHPHSKRELNREIFAIAAPCYDRITRVLSFGRDRVWKDLLVASLPDRPMALCVDLACGTGDLTRRLALRYPQAQVMGVDLTGAMLERARAQSAGVEQVQYRQGDMGQTGLADGAADLVTGGYALRNAGDLDEALRLVQSAIEHSHASQPAMLDTLAAVYAARGDFPQAVRIQQQVVAQSRGQLQPDDEYRLRLYQHNRPFRLDLDPKADTDVR